MSFKDLIHQPKVVTALEEGFRHDRLAHAFLFAGPAGAGQRAMAMEFAKTLFCSDRHETHSCGLCADCRQVAKNAHPDLEILEPQKDSLVIKIEEIRAMIAKAGFKPFQAPAKVFVIDPAETMNEVAQNAILKTLEEPEARTYFILISYAPEKLLATVRSRTQMLNFLPTGSAGPVEAQAEKFKLLALEYVLRCLRSEPDPLAEPDFAKVERAALGSIFDFVIEWFRHALVIRAGASALLEEVLDLPRKEAIAREYSAEELSELIELLAEFKKRILGFANVKLTLSVLSSRLSAFRADPVPRGHVSDFISDSNVSPWDGVR